MECSVVGKRIACDGHIGTVLYEGPVPPTEGNWLGIDWDDPLRGKHDGSYKGKKYFAARCSTSGSFIRPQKADFGVTFCEAVRQRYGFDEECLSACIDPTEMYHLGANNVLKPIEILGLDKLGHQQSQYDLLKIVVLRGLKVAGTMCEEKISQITPNISELDLSKNLINSWEVVAEITGQLPRLESLTISENCMSIPDDPTSFSSNFSTVKKLILCHMNYNWNQILDCSKMCLNVVELHIAHNCISILQSPDTNILEKLRMLDLDSNAIVHWREVLKLGHLPCLETLHVNDCKIEDIFFPDVLPGNRTALFSKLSSLALNENKCSKWIDVSELYKLSSLSTLLMNHNPICEMETPETTRQLFIAKLANLKVLNRITIQSDERRGAELDYLKKYGRIWLDAKGDSARLPHDFLQEHPRYKEIGFKYGAVEKEELVTHSSKLKSNIIFYSNTWCWIFLAGPFESVKITSPLLPDSSFITRKLPATMTVLKLKNLLQMLYKVDAFSLDLTYKSAKKSESDSEIPLDNDQRELSFFSLENDDTVIVRW